MQRIIAVMSGKGGVGKTSVAVLVAKVLSEKYKTIILDFDICGPSVTTALGISGALVKTASGFKALPASKSLDALSFGSILKPDDAVIWRGPKKQVFLDLFFNSAKDYECIVVDTPPGISEEHDFLAGKGASAIIVTTPQNVALSDSQQCIEFCLDSGIDMLGVVENMSWLSCKGCAATHHPFGSRGGRLLAEEYGLGFLGELEIEPRWSELIDSGEFNEKYQELAAYRFFKERLIEI